MTKKLEPLAALVVLDDDDAHMANEMLKLGYKVFFTYRWTQGCLWWKKHGQVFVFTLK